ncbi:MULTISPECIES: hypothetical protein [unclassified Paenarthrobacter]|uniref:hypothetical protein n=1 Tax=unclassified Paenarthrobacter TaxID=2634190 RepID=UPI00084E9C0D|nr:hypothetical protein [Paenarthrobacter sp. R1]NKR10628.1 hypothetical protein [Arthrobacter sp. M5]NKR16469.1 hypothetical protein [Arthrobacter sp. M6]OEH61422.1 hypothetical protein A5N13_16895 [Arthrobacter sp. D4]OEH64408.1 hypothetical protein A5N17_06290 [Arthrobacter sp. D2]WIV29188.1 hypothetical protein QN084_12450 [Paenarthrobacter sp. R1]
MQRKARRAAALVIVVLASVSLALARVADVTGPVRQFETIALIPAIAVLMVVMAGYLIRGRSAGQPLVLTRRRWKYRVLMITAVAGAGIVWPLSLVRPHEFLIAAYVPAVLANLIFNLFERRTPNVHGPKGRDQIDHPSAT